MKHGWLIALTVAGTLASGGCQGDLAGERGHAATRVQVAGLSLDGNERSEQSAQWSARTPVAAADARGGAARPDAGTRFQLESGDIEAAFKTDKTRCEAYGGRERQACLEVAQREYERKLSEAKLRREGTQRSRDAARKGRVRLLYC